MIGIIGGSGIYKLTDKADSIDKKIISTVFGDPVEVSLLDIEDKQVAFISRHAQDHSLPPHKINFKANIDVLKNLGVTKIIATNSVGSLNYKISPGSFILPTSFLDFTTVRDKTFFNDDVVHVDMTEPYCPSLNKVIAECGEDVMIGGTYVCTEGPRFETTAEIKMFRMLSGDVVGMTGLPEVVLAREKEICYSSICIVSNFAAGMSSEKLTIDEVFQSMDKIKNKLINLIYKTIGRLENKDDDDGGCNCKDSLNGSKV